MIRILSGLVFCCTAFAVQAGSLETAPTISEPMLTPISVGVGSAWEGVYVGGFAAYETGEQNYFSGGTFSNGPWGLEGIAYGAFAGINFQSGSLVYGAEAAYSIGEINSDVPSTFGANYSSFVDIKARAGYSIGDALVYGTLGGSLGYWEDRTGPPDTASSTGINYGLGVDYLINDRMFVGAEYMVRDLAGDFDTDPSVGLDSLTQSARIRVGLQF